MSTTIASTSAGGGAPSTAGVSAAATRRVSRMDEAAIATLIEEAAKKSGLLWVRATGVGRRPQPMWHLWHDGVAYLLTGGIEQPAPDGLADRAFVTLASKDKGSRLITFEATVDVVAPGGDEWS